MFLWYRFRLRDNCQVFYGNINIELDRSKAMGPDSQWERDRLNHLGLLKGSSSMLFVLLASLGVLTPDISCYSLKNPKDASLIPGGHQRRPSQTTPASCHQPQRGCRDPSAPSGASRSNLSIDFQLTIRLGVVSAAQCRVARRLQSDAPATRQDPAATDGISLSDLGRRGTADERLSRRCW